MNNNEMTKDICKYAVPCIAERMLITFACMISSIFMGRLGAKELAAVSVSNTIIEIVQSLLIGLGIGATVFISIRFANNDSKKINQASFNYLIISIIFAMIFFGIFSVGVKGIVYLLFRKSDPKVKEMTVRYLQTIKWALPCLAIDVGVTACLRGVKNAKLPFAFTLIVNLINIVLCVLFIFKMNFGYIGGAYAYNISIMAGSIAKLLVVILPITDIHINHLYKMDMGIIKQIIKIGFPTLFEQFWVKTGFLGMQTITALLGTFTLAGYQISSNVFNILYAITAGLETTMITFVSGYNASGEPQKSEKTTFGIVKYAEIIMLLLGIIVFAFAPNISAFFSNDSAVISSAVKIIRIMCITLPFTTYFQSIQGVLKICPDVKVVIIMNILNTWFLRVPISYVFVKYCGLDFYGLFIGFLVDYITRSIGFGVEAKKKRWLYRSIK